MSGKRDGSPARTSRFVDVPAEVLFAEAVSQPNGGREYDQRFKELIARPTQETFDLAMELSRHDDPDYRLLALSVLTNLGRQAYPFANAAFPRLREAAYDEPDEEVRRLAIYGFCFSWSNFDPSITGPAISDLSKLSRDPSPVVRRAVAGSLAQVTIRHDWREYAYRCHILVRMSSDQDSCVRENTIRGFSWLVFVVWYRGVEIAPVLRRLLPEVSTWSRWTALHCLVYLGEPGMVPLVRRELEMSHPDVLAPMYWELISSAMELKHRSLVPGLRALRRNPALREYQRVDIDRAIAACSGGKHRGPRRHRSRSSPRRR